MSTVYLSIFIFSFLHWYLTIFEYRYFTTLVRPVPRLFVLSHAIANRIIFLISLSDSLLLVNRNDFGDIERQISTY